MFICTYFFPKKNKGEIKYYQHLLRGPTQVTSLVFPLSEPHVTCRECWVLREWQTLLSAGGRGRRPASCLDFSLPLHKSFVCFKIPSMWLLLRKQDLQLVESLQHFVLRQSMTVEDLNSNRKMRLHLILQHYKFSSFASLFDDDN